MIMIVHGSEDNSDEVRNSLRDGPYAFLEEFSIVACLMFSFGEGTQPHKVLEKEFPIFEGCGDCTEFLLSLVHAYFLCRGKDTVSQKIDCENFNSGQTSITRQNIISKENTTIRTMKGFLVGRSKEDNFDKEMEINDDTVAWLKKDIKRILTTPSIIKNYIPNTFDATGGICISIGAIMENMNGKIQTRV